MISEPYEYTDPSTGEVVYREVIGYRTPGGRILRTAPGFSYNPGRAAFGADMELARKLSLVQDVNLRGQVTTSYTCSASHNKTAAELLITNW